MLKPGHAGTTDSQMASAGQRGCVPSVFKFTSTHLCQQHDGADQAAFFLATFSSFLSFLIFFSIFLI